jgi:hypothetical protein
MNSPTSEQPSAASARRAWRRRWPLFLGVAAAALVAASLAMVRFAPGPIAENLARTWLRGHGAESAIDIVAISDHALIAKVRLGDANHPDLTIDRLELTYRLEGPWNGAAVGLHPLTVRLVRPRLKLRYVDGRMDFGQANGLVAWIRSQPPSTEPLPDIAIREGDVLFNGPNGVLRLTGSGAVKAGREGELHGAIAPFRQSAGDFTLTGKGGRYVLRLAKGRARAELVLEPLTATSGTRQLTAAATKLVAELPLPDVKDALRGEGRATLAVDGISAVGKGETIEGGVLRVAALGILNGSLDALTFAGSLRGEGGAANAAADATTLKGARASFNLTSLSLAVKEKTLAARARGDGQLDAAAVRTTQGVASDLVGAVSLVDGRFDLADGRVAGGATLAGRLAGRGAPTAASLTRFVASIPQLDGERPYGRPLAAAMREVRFDAPDWRLTLDRDNARLTLAAPVTLTGASGARLALGGEALAKTGPTWRASGAARVRLEGGGLPDLTLTAPSWTLSPGRAEAKVAVQGVFTIGPLEDAAMTFQGHIEATPTRVAVDLDNCGAVRVRHLGPKVDGLDALAFDVCADGGPLFITDASGWRGRGRVDRARLDATGPVVGLRDASLSFDLAGSAAGPRAGQIVLAGARVVDGAKALRFSPLNIAGRLGLDGQGWSGATSVAGVSGRRLGGVTLRQPGASGAGRLEIHADGLDFAPGGLQPADLTPLISGARNASGHVGFDGWVSWAGDGKTESGGELVARALNFTGPAGPVENLNAKVRLTSLAPLVSAPSQTLTIGAVRTVTPLTNVSLVFDFDAERLRAERVSGDFAGGSLSVEPFSAPLSAARTFGSALVLSHVDVGQVLDASNLSDKVKLQAKVDGRVPFTLGPDGLTVQKGSLVALSGGRISISREAFTGSAPAVTPAGQSSFAQDFAYQALENLAFDKLDATLNSQAHDRLGVIFHIKGRHDPPARQRAVFNLFDLLAGKAMSKPVPLPSGTMIDLTLDTSLNFGDLVQALEQAWQDALHPGRPANPQALGSAATSTAKTQQPMESR